MSKHMANPLHALLAGYQYTTLLRIAEFNGIGTASSKGHKLDKPALIAALIERLSTLEQTNEAFSRLNAIERATLDRLLLHKGEAPTEMLRDELANEAIVQPGLPSPYRHYESDPFDPQADTFENVMGRLTLHGLAFTSGIPPSWTQKKLGFTPGLRLIVPEPIRSHLPQRTLPSVEWGQGNLPAPVEETNIAFGQRQLFTYWSYVRAQPLPLTQAAFVQKRMLRSIAEHLLSPDPSLGSASNERDAPHLYFMRLLLQELGLLIEDHDQVRLARGPSHVPGFWLQPPVDRAKACLEAWLRMRNWNELASLKLSSFDLDLPRARSTMCEQLRLLSPGVWVSAERFLSRLEIIAPRLLFQATAIQPTASYYPNMGHGLPQTRRLLEIEGAFVDRALSGPLHWLGVVDISVDEDRLLAFRINAGGARALGMELTVEAESDREARVVVQPNFRIFALGPVPEAALAQLEMFADRVKADRSAFEYTLSRETVYRAQQESLTVADMVAFLEQASSLPVPQNVLRSLQEWGEQYKRVIFHRAVSLCQAADAELLQQLWDDTALHQHLERRLTPTVAIVKRRRLAALQEALLQRDMLPAVSPKDDPCTGRVQATPEGELSPVNDGPDLLLEACLHRLAEERKGRFYISEAAVTRACSGGMSVAEYLEQLATLHRGPLPAELQSRVKAWGCYYGKAHLRKAVLLEVKDSATAAELLADAELATLLSRFPADPRGRLLLVLTDDLETLRDALRERGVELI